MKENYRQSELLDTQQMSEDITEIIMRKIEQSAGKLEGFPHTTRHDKWETTPDGYWSGGFWIGLLWWLFKISGDNKYMELAHQWLRKLERRKKDRTFDLGFLFYPSFSFGYEITGAEPLRKTALEAADTLCELFEEKVGFMCNEISMNNKRLKRTAIDVMMNLSLLWWAYQETSDEKYYRVAFNHCQNTMGSFMRKDYSTRHIIDFDLETGEITNKTTQGYSDDSCWSRGQAWAIYGFTLAYKSSRNKRFLGTAEGLADYFIASLPDDYVPYWDFNDPDIPNTVRDSSAAAIAGSGLFTLAELSQKQRFREAATNILDSLATNYLAQDAQGILKHGCFHKPENLGVDESLIWGDYYFVEALTKAGLVSCRV